MLDEGANLLVSQGFQWDVLNSRRISLTSPLEGAALTSGIVQLSGTILAAGSTTLPPSAATTVEVFVDDEATAAASFEILANTSQWTEAVDLGTRTGSLLVRLQPTLAGASGTSVRIGVGSYSVGTNQFEYVTSSDGAVLDGVLWWPHVGGNPNAPLSFADPAVSLVTWLHGAGVSGDAMVEAVCITSKLNARTWIGVAPHGRRFPLELDCPDWTHTFTYYDSTDNPEDDGVFCHGETDIFDAMDWARFGSAETGSAGLPINAESLFLMGHSQGARGAMTIGLKHPHLFAAVGVSAPVTDTYANFARGDDPATCLGNMFQGFPHQTNTDPTQQAIVDNNYSETSPRFLIENAHSLPIFHAHGDNDGSAYNVFGDLGEQWLEGYNLQTVDWDTCHVVDLNEYPFTGPLCFGKTPNVDDLKTAVYLGGFQALDRVFTSDPSGHSLSCDDEENHNWTDPIFDFFDDHSTRVVDPDTVVYKTYRSIYTDAHWLRVRIAECFDRRDKPAAVIAQAIPEDNALQIQFARAAEIEFDPAPIGLALDPANFLNIDLKHLVPELDRFDPNVYHEVECPAEGESPPQPPASFGDPYIIIRGDYRGYFAYGVLWPSGRVFIPFITAESMTVGPIPGVTDSFQLLVIGVE